MLDLLIRILDDLGARVSGPMEFRLVLQPAMAALFAILSGVKDAKTGKPPYFWSLWTDPAHRVEMLKDGWRSVGRVFVLALLMDAFYQYKVQGFIYPGEAIIVAFLLAIVPYLVLRGTVTRFSRHYRPRSGPGPS